MSTTLLAGFRLPIMGARTEATIADGRTPSADPEQVSEGQIPLPSLLLAALLSGSLWWGLIAGARWVWLAI